MKDHPTDAIIGSIPKKLDENNEALMKDQQLHVLPQIDFYGTEEFKEIPYE